MDLHRAVGQLITGKVVGYELDSDTSRLITGGTIGGVTLFKDNARDLSQLVRLCSDLHGAWIDKSSPFLITVDQEGGAVQRFDHILTPLPSPMALAGQPDLQLVRQLMSASARQLRLLGVNCVLAPVLDINSNDRNPIIGTRSFGAERARVVQLASVVAQAYLDEGVLPVGKHFPGHGDTFEDSHLKLAVVHATREMLDERELYPFKEMVSTLPSMLVGHIWMTELDEQALPATLSPNAIQKLLRKEFRYDGFLFSDDMPVMKAIVDHWGLEEAAVMGVKAGLDNLLISGTIEQIRSVHAALVDAVKSNEISEDRLKSALRRREKALSYCRDERPADLAERESVLAQEIQNGNELTAQASARCIARVRGRLLNPANAPHEWVLVTPHHPRYRLDILSSLMPHIPPGASALRERKYSLNPTPDEIADVVTFAYGQSCLFMTFRALLNKGQLELGKALASKCRSGLLVASDVPYELNEMLEWPNAVATFDPSDLAMNALSDVLTANAKPSGNLALAACPPY